MQRASGGTDQLCHLRLQPVHILQEVRVAAPPVDGRANAAVTDLLATELGLKSAGVTVTAGDTSRTKRIRLAGLDPDDADNALERLLTRSQTGGGPAPKRR